MEIIRKLKHETENFSFQHPANKSLALKILEKRNILAPESYNEFFPVELLKEDGEKYFINDCKTTFISSGTTQSKRSKSCFSHDGLFLYKINAIVGFIDVLLKTGHDPDDFAGLSLIPDCKAWPNSSLAQMIEWLTDYFDVSYIDNQDRIEIKKLLSKRENPPGFSAPHLIMLTC